MMQKKFEKELERVEGLRTQMLQTEGSVNAWWFIMKIVFQELGVIVFHYEDDKIVLNEKGKPVIDWLAILANVPTILAKVAAIIADFEKFKGQQWDRE